MAKNAKKINIITLGCAKNIVDSEQLAAKASAAGYNVVHNSNHTDFDIAFVNTCGFINDAKEESINTILQLVNLKINKKIKKVVVFGCLAERYFDDLKIEIPEVDLFSGNYDVAELLESIEIVNWQQNDYQRIQDNAGHYAYLKIAEGCNRNCSFCAIPLFKGKYVSRNIDDIIDEAKYLAEQGVKELILIAQDLSFYGYDIDKTLQLPNLVTRLSEIETIQWIRLHYLYPFMFPDNLIDVIANNEKVCKYFDIPMQHISNKVLDSMNRGGTKEDTIRLLNDIRTAIPDAAIRTTMMVGHPGEGEAEFNELMDFVKEQKFDRLGVFTYSEEEGTKSEKNYEDSIPEQTKQKRAEILMDLQRDISYELNSAKIGKIFKVIIDTVEDNNSYVGRTEFDSVEVDNEVIVRAETKLKVGDFVNVIIKGYDDFELFAEKI